jgi:hypothetical protein
VDGVVAIGKGAGGLVQELVAEFFGIAFQGIEFRGQELAGEQEGD